MRKILLIGILILMSFLSYCISEEKTDQQPLTISNIELTPKTTTTTATTVTTTTPTPKPTPTPVDLREKLWRYKLKYALEVTLSNSELDKIQSIANELRGEDIAESAYNILEWEARISDTTNLELTNRHLLFT